MLSIGQLFFDDAWTDQVALLSPYLSRNITRVLNAVDGVYTGQNGSYSLLPLTLTSDNAGLQNGVIESIILGINSSAIPPSVGGGGGGGGDPTTLNPNPSTSTLKSKGNSFTIMNFALVLFHFLVFLLISA
jgi:hypothetical protein